MVHCCTGESQNQRIGDLGPGLHDFRGSQNDLRDMTNHHRAESGCLVDRRMTDAFDGTVQREHFERGNYLFGKVKRVYLRPMQISKSLAEEK